jgi:hypothetical protein
MQKQALVVYNWLGVIDYISSRLTQESKEYMTTGELIEQRTQPVNVTVCPKVDGFGEEVIVVVVAVLLTVSVRIC